ncbi:cytochrome c-type biogenesis protein [Actibacterium sp. D379-3]
MRIPLPARLRPALLALMLALLTAPMALALDADEMFADPAQETRAREIGRQLRCLVCQNQSIFDSNAGLAKDLRVLVRERMAAGDTDAQVLRHISDRFGDYVLLKPRWSAKNAVLWLTPALALLFGLSGAVVYARGRKPPAGLAGMSDTDRAEARKLLEGDRT